VNYHFLDPTDDSSIPSPGCLLVFPSPGGIEIEAILCPNLIRESPHVRHSRFHQHRVSRASLHPPPQSHQISHWSILETWDVRREILWLSCFLTSVSDPKPSPKAFARSKSVILFALTRFSLPWKSDVIHRNGSAIKGSARFRILILGS
jgi:hypothetical protein